MRVVVDTNVLISGVLFSGAPLRILEAWQKKRIEIVVSPEILEEYCRIGERLADQFEDVPLEPLLTLLVANAVIVEARQLASRSRQRSRR